jgi:hypothetical protein
LKKKLSLSARATLLKPVSAVKKRLRKLRLKLKKKPAKKLATLPHKVTPKLMSLKVHVL